MKGTKRKAVGTTTKRAARATTKPDQRAETYRHKEADSPLRPEVGTQARFKKKKPPQTYRYDSSLSPALDWDGQNGVRELGEWLLARVEEAAALPAPHVVCSGGFDTVQREKRLQQLLDVLLAMKTDGLAGAGRMGR